MCVCVYKRFTYINCPSTRELRQEDEIELPPGGV